MNLKRTYTISRGFWPESNFKFVMSFSVTLKDFRISGAKFFFLSSLPAKIFKYRFSCISGLNSKNRCKRVFRLDKNYAYSIFQVEFEKKRKKLASGPTFKTQKLTFCLLKNDHLVVYCVFFQFFSNILKLPMKNAT